MRGENAVVQLAEKFCRREAALELAFLRPGADDDFAAGQIERQERRQVLFDGDPAHGHEDRPRKIEIDRAIGPEQIDVDAARPHAEIAKAAFGKLGHQRRRRHHGHRGGGMKTPQHVVDPLLRDRRARRDIFGKARRVARRERPAVSDAVGPHRMADRAFGRDMNCVGARRLDALGDAFSARHGEPQARIGRHRESPKPVGRQEIDLDAEFGGGARQRAQRPHHAVDLRTPSVRRDQDFHRGDFRPASCGRHVFESHATDNCDFISHSCDGHESPRAIFGSAT